ncbi:MAG: trypsin-like peptidase domain-containing protein [Pseudomonadota bacterium]
MYLTGPQIKEFVDAFGPAFLPQRFDQLLLGRLNKNRANISMADDYVTILYAVVDTANREGWAIQLLDAARASNPGNPHLLALEEALGIGTIAGADKVNLEKVVNERSNFDDPLQFRERLGQLESWVCAIEMPGGGGTGFLMQSDVVLTNYHVVENVLNNAVSPTGVRCRFDYKVEAGGNMINSGSAVGLAADWDIAHTRYSDADTQVGAVDGWAADELDFALVRLAEPVGNAPIGSNAEPMAPSREWLKLKRTPATSVQNDVAFILQHPQDIEAAGASLQPLRLAIGIITGFAGNGMRVRHDTRTLPGSSGSPIFNANLELVALHHAGEPNNRLDYRGNYNQAIPITEIARYMDQNGLGQMLHD